ncbi:MAG: OmpA family protein [Gemmatimonadales bacterium]
MFRRLLPACLILTFFGTTSLAAQRLYRVELSGAGGYHTYDSKTKLAATIGGALRLGYWIYGPLSVELEGTLANPKTNTSLKKAVSTSTLGGWLLGNIAVGRTTFVILKGGYGHLSYGACPTVSLPGAGPCGAADVFQGGAGVRIALSPTLFMRYEGTMQRSLTSLKFTNLMIQGGVSLMLGSTALTDHDGDGVYDRSDACADTPLGALIDSRGCPTDRDADGVPDGLDRCPNTLSGAAVDTAGCSHDSDGDGYLDGIDRCPETPAGALVDSTGCPADSDADGVWDGLDRCPLTPAGATVDALGCPSDTDADGVPDGVDQCPETRGGTAVDLVGCPTAPEVVPTDTTPDQQVWVLPGTAWQLRGSSLASDATTVLDSIATVMLVDSTTTVEVHGFAHDRLVPGDNLKLSQRRADAIRNYLVTQGISVSRITSIGRGAQPLLVADTTEAARTINRRAEITVKRRP